MFNLVQKLYDLIKSMGISEKLFINFGHTRLILWTSANSLSIHPSKLYLLFALSAITARQEKNVKHVFLFLCTFCVLQPAVPE